MVPAITRLEPKVDKKLRALAKKNERSIAAELRIAVKAHVKEASK